MFLFFIFQGRQDVCLLFTGFQDDKHPPQITKEYFRLQSLRPYELMDFSVLSVSQSITVCFWPQELLCFLEMNDP